MGDGIYLYHATLDVSTDRDSTVQFIIILLIPPTINMCKAIIQIKKIYWTAQKTRYTELPAGCIEPVAVLQGKRYKEVVNSCRMVSAYTTVEKFMVCKIFKQFKCLMLTYALFI